MIMAKVIFSAPLKALSNEKYEDWSKLFPDKKILQLTGDTLTSQKIRLEMMKEAETADILIMTAELLDSVTRNHYSEHYQWVKHVQLLVVDEAHGVTMEGRGHVIEASIMRFCEIAPQAKVWFMSATMPNCEEFAQWLTTLNKKPSEIINSTWRPTELRWNFIPHNAFGSYWENQDDKIRKAIEIVQEHQNESTLVFVHDKNTGRRIDAILKDLGIACEFYNADLDTETRHDLLKRFESENNDRIAALISTSALAWGCNTSAQNAIIVGVARGIQPVDELDIVQEAGRAGRFGKAPYGNVFLICDNIPEWKEKVAHPRNVTSTLLDTYALAFHLCAEIKNKVIKDYDTMYTWYHRTLASIQSPLEKQHIDEVLNALQNWKAIVINPDNTFSITALGTVAATLYFHPEDVHHWWQCFSHIERQNLWKNDLCIAYGLSAPSMQLPYIPRSEEATVQTYFNALRQVWRNGPYLKQSTLSRDVHDLLCGDKATPQSRPLQSDAERIVGAISWIMGIAKMGIPDMLKILPIRLRYGVSAELCALVQLPGIGGVRAKKLAAMGITTWQDVIRNPDKIQRVIGEKNVKKIIASARNLIRVHLTEHE
jgi:helicase